MGDVAPCATIYVNNLNEKIKKDGAFRVAFARRGEP